MRTITLTILLTTFLGASAQDFKKEFNDLVAKQDTVGQLELLEKWEVANSSDPEMFVAYFNYYVNRSRQEVIEIGQDPQGETVLQIMDTDTTNTEPVAYMYGNTQYNPGLLTLGFDYADKGIETNPTRLDIRFGKIYMYGEVEDWKSFTEEIINTIDHSYIIQNKWIWSDNKAVDDPKKFMLSSIQDYQLQLYNTFNDDLLDNMKLISEDVL